MCSNACLLSCSAVRSTSTRPKVWWRYCLISSLKRTRAHTRLNWEMAAPRTNSLWSLWTKVSHKSVTCHHVVILASVTFHNERQAQKKSGESWFLNWSAPFLYDPWSKWWTSGGNRGTDRSKYKSVGDSYGEKWQKKCWELFLPSCAILSSNNNRVLV